MVCRIIILVFIFFYLGLLLDVHARVGLRVRFTEAVIEGLKVGYTYNIREMGRIPYTVINAGDMEVEVETVVEVPGEKQLMENYEPIPAVDWIKVVPARVKLLPGEEKDADVIISIPPDEQYANRHFQAMLWSYTVSIGGEAAMFNVGVRSRVRFSTTMCSEEAPEENLKKKHRRSSNISSSSSSGSMSRARTLNVDFTPESLHLFDIEPGRKYYLKELTEEKLKLTNREDVKFKVELLCTVPLPQFAATAGGSSSSGMLHVPSGYEYVPDVNNDGICPWVRIHPREFVIKPNTVKEVKLTIEVPKEEKYYNKKYICLIKCKIYNLLRKRGVERAAAIGIGSATEEKPVEIISRIYISTIAK